ncbi:hypothetical protein FOMPIDRAFT_1021506 [Fomitopsis schrenkii]|uniref:Uncharacterized protein n=1 Tax=Fomitopsis schrenkii TaxID=2126942 RepID=S8EQ76_FOMSC|nr:hypothetical protein FOMPIDRAFT_1021506 [Fomitopsis schrenkii]
MTTTFKAVSTLCVAMLAAILVSAAPALVERDVWDPEIITPNAATVWYTGQKYNVTWRTDNAPVNISDKFGTVVLGNNGIQGQALLADNFSLLLGSVEITVPEDLVPGLDYDIVLFGDSGNESPAFAIL